MTVPNTAAGDASVNNTNRRLIFKNCVPFTNCVSEITNTRVDDAQDIDDMAMPMYNLL